MLFGQERKAAAGHPVHKLFAQKIKKAPNRSKILIFEFYSSFLQVRALLVCIREARTSRGANHHTGHADITERSDRMTTMTSTAALAQDSTANTTYWIEGMQKDQEALGSALAFADACTSPRREDIGQENEVVDRYEDVYDHWEKQCGLHFGARSWGSGGTGSPYTAKHVRLSSRDTHPGPFLGNRRR